MAGMFKGVVRRMKTNIKKRLRKKVKKMKKLKNKNFPERFEKDSGTYIRNRNNKQTLEIVLECLKL